MGGRILHELPERHQLEVVRRLRRSLQQREQLVMDTFHRPGRRQQNIHWNKIHNKRLQLIPRYLWPFFSICSDARFPSSGNALSCKETFSLLYYEFDAATREPPPWDAERYKLIGRNAHNELQVYDKQQSIRRLVRTKDQMIRFNNLTVCTQSKKRRLFFATTNCLTRY